MSRRKDKEHPVAEAAADVVDGVLDVGGSVVEAIGDGAGAALEGMGGCAEGCGGCATAIVLVVLPLGAVAIWQGASLLA